MSRRRCRRRLRPGFFYFLKALFYIPCNTGGESAGLIGHCFAVAIQCLSIHLPPPGWCDLGVQLAFFTVTTRRLCSSFKPNHISYFTLEGFYNFLFTLLKTVFKSFEMRDFFLFLAAFNIIAICVWGLMAGRCKSGGLQRDRPGCFLFLELKLDGMRISELLYIVLNSLLHFFKLHLWGVDRGF